MTWEIICKTKEALYKEIPSECINLRINSGRAEIELDDPEGDYDVVIAFKPGEYNTNTLIMAEAPFLVDVVRNTIFSDSELDQFRLYLGYALLPYFSKRLGKCFTIAHFAQTLDGKIASSTGDSKWIGNEENLVHAHRMRALCDGIVVGARTLKADNPRLNVRLVQGKDPVKIVIGGDDLKLEDYEAIDQESIVFSQNHISESYSDQIVRLKKEKKTYATRDLLDVLFEKGLCSVYVEGGSYTTSSFLTEGSIDQVQVHITPKIMGSGITGFQFSGLEKIEDAVEFTSYRFQPVGDHVMFIGELMPRYNGVQGIMA